jgi:uncharacterized repeat protein (TIGR02543 family)
MKDRKSKFLMWTNGIVTTAIIILLLLLFLTPKVTVNARAIGDGNVTGSGRYKVGSEVILQANLNSGSRFYAWIDEENVIVSTDNPYKFIATKSMVQNPIQLGAKFYLNTAYTIVLDYGEYQTLWDAPGENINQFNIGNPTKLGYEFVGWFTNAARTSAVDWSTLDLDALEDDSVVTFYAKFTPNPYTIHFIGEDPDDSDSIAMPAVPGDINATYDTSVTLTPYSGDHGAWFFKGWDTSDAATTVVYANGQNVLNLTATKDAVINLYAVFSDEASVIFNLAYATGSTSSMGSYLITEVNGTDSTSAGLTSIDLGTSGGTVTVTASLEFGYKFVGWYSDLAGTTLVSASNPYTSSTLTTSTTYYAKYALLAESTINLYYNGVLVQPITILEGHTQYLPDIIVSGTETTTTWYVDANGNGIYDPAIDTVTATYVTGPSTATPFNFVAKVVEQAEFIFDTNEIPVEWRSTLTFGAELAKGISVRYYNGTGDVWLKMTQIGSTGIYHAYIPTADRALVLNYQFRFWQDSTSTGTVGSVDEPELKYSNTIVSTVAEGEDVQLHFVNTWVGDNWTATKSYSHVVTLSFDAGQVIAWGGINTLQVQIFYGPNLDSPSGFIMVDAGALQNRVYTVELASELGIDHVVVWFNQNTTPKLSMNIAWGVVGTVTFDPTFNGDGGTWVNGWKTYNDHNGTPRDHWAVVEAITETA